MHGNLEDFAQHPKLDPDENLIVNCELIEDTLVRCQCLATSRLQSNIRQNPTRPAGELCTELPREATTKNIRKLAKTTNDTFLTGKCLIAGSQRLRITGHCAFLMKHRESVVRNTL